MGTWCTEISVILADGFWSLIYFCFEAVVALWECGSGDGDFEVE